MANHSEDSASSLDDSDDLDDVPLSMAPNGRYEYDEPPLTSRGPPLAFMRPGVGFHLKLPVPRPEETTSPGAEGLQAMRSEPLYLGEAPRGRTPPVLSMGPARAASTSYNGGADEPENALGRRGPLKPPMLSLINPASASPVPSGAPTPGVTDSGEVLRRVNAWAPSEPPRRQPVRVDLVSSAFILQGPALNDAAAGAAGGPAGDAPTSDRIVQRCCSQLGIAACDLELFELRPLEDGVIPEACTRVGVMIRGSTFSLSALEDLLARSKRDSQLASMLEGSLRESSQHAAEAKLSAEKLAKQNEELAVLRERLRGLEAANQHLRDQLQRSDEHRQLLGGTIRTIKKEFEDFKSRVVVEGSLEQQLHQLALGGGTSATSTIAGSAAVAPTAAASGAGPAAAAAGPGPAPSGIAVPPTTAASSAVGSPPGTVSGGTAGGPSAAGDPTQPREGGARR